VSLKEICKEIIELILLRTLTLLDRCGIHVRWNVKGHFVLIMNKDIKILLVQEKVRVKIWVLLLNKMSKFFPALTRFVPAEEPAPLGFPGGRPNKGESAESAAEREVWEETGLLIKIVRLIIEGKEVIEGVLNLSFTVSEGRVVGGTLNPDLQGAALYSPKEILHLHYQGRLLGNYVHDAIGEHLIREIEEGRIKASTSPDAFVFLAKTYLGEKQFY